MKKCLYFLIILFLITHVITSAITDKKTEFTNAKTLKTSSTIDDEIDNTLENLDVSEIEKFIEELEIYNEDFNFKSLIKDVLYGNDEFDFNYLLSYVIKVFSGNFRNELAQAIIIIIICLLFSILNNLTSNFSKTSTKKIVYFVCYGLIITIIGYMLSSSITQTQNTLSRLNTFINAIFPVLITLMTAIGATTTVAIYQPIILIFSTTIINLITYIIIPLFYINLVFSIIGNFSDDLKLNKISNFTKSISDWIIGIVFGLFVTIITARGITGASLDSLALRGTKYALSNYVPIIGGQIKDSFDIIIAGCIVIKNAIGYVSLFFLLIFMLAPIIKILITIFVLRFTSSIVEPMGEQKISATLYNVSKSLTTLVVVLIMSCFSLVIILTLILASCNMGLL